MGLSTNILVPYKNPFVNWVKDEGLQSAASLSVIKKDAFLDATDTITAKIVEFGARYKFTNFEWQVDLAGMATTLADKLATGAIVCLQAEMMVSHFLNITLPYLIIVTTIVRIVTVPLSLFILGAGIIEGCLELIQINRIVELLHVVRKENSTLQKLEWFEIHYFCLNTDEMKHIESYINKWLPDLTLDEKAHRFDRVATKILKIKYEKLQRRITPDLAHEVSINIDAGSKELKNKETAPIAIKRFETLFSAIEQQAKVKIISHTLLFLAISVGLIGTIASLGGFAGIPLIIALVATVTALLASKYLIDYGIINRAAINLYDKMEELKLLAMESLEKYRKN